MSAMETSRPRADDRRLPLVEVVPMRRRHLRSVLRIEAHNPNRPWSLGLFMSELRMKTGRVYSVARVAGEVVGFAGMLFSGADGHVTTIAVDPEWRRHQIGTRLMLLLARRARGYGATAMTLEVRMGNAEAQGLYRKFGMVPAGVRRNYYSDVNEDALVMWAHEIDGAEYARRLDRIESRIAGPTEYRGWE